MDHIGIDVHKKSSCVCVLRADGTRQELDVATERSALAAVLGPLPRSKVLIEASTESEWVARVLEGLGHEVVVADPNYALMYATRSSKIKTDRRDARALAEACRLGHYRPAHRTSGVWRSARRQLSVRDALVRSRTRLISLTRALLRQEGLRVGSGASESFAARVGKMELDPELAAVLKPAVRMTRALTGAIGRADQRMQALARDQARVRRLMTAPGVGRVTALAFAAVVEPASRFDRGEQVACYLGLAPSENSSSERRQVGPVTKQGDRRVRWLLVEAAWRVMRGTDAEARPLRRWAQKIAERRGKSKAAVALARKLAVLLWAMDRDGKDYQPPDAEPDRRTRGRRQRETAGVG